MPFAVLQKSLDVPAVEKMERALLTVPGFTRVDARIFANDAFGILVKNLSLERANEFAQALGREGIEIQVVSETDLTPLPPTKFVQRLDCTPDALVIYDPLGRSFALEWRHVMLIAAGCVRMTEFKRVETVVMGTMDSQGNAYPVTAVKNFEERNDRLLLEIVLTDAVLRYSISAEKFRFDYLGERRAKSLPENFTRLVQDLAAFAPQALVNRGAYFLRQNEPLFFYPGKNAFFEEIIWLLWRMKNEGARGES